MLSSTLLGIGKFIALDFARRGARVILACRSESRGTAALKEIREKTGNSDVHLQLVDLSSLESVREFAKRILDEEKALHILVNNAGVSGDTRAHCRDSFVCWRLKTKSFFLFTFKLPCHTRFTVLSRSIELQNEALKNI